MSTDSEPTILIINPDGCNVLDSLVRKIEQFLTSYGVCVKTIANEESEVIQSGGMPSYLHRNIETCDFVVVMFTKCFTGISFLSSQYRGL